MSANRADYNPEPKLIIIGIKDIRKHACSYCTFNDSAILISFTVVATQDHVPDMLTCFSIAPSSFIDASHGFEHTKNIAKIPKHWKYCRQAWIGSFVCQRSWEYCKQGWIG